MGVPQLIIGCGPEGSGDYFKTYQYRYNPANKVWEIKCISEDSGFLGANFNEVTKKLSITADVFDDTSKSGENGTTEITVDPWTD